MIHFDVTNVDGDRELRVAGTGTLVGWIEQGRRMTNVTRNWTEWGFTPIDGPMSPVRENIATAYDDARAYAERRLS